MDAPATPTAPVLDSLRREAAAFVRGLQDDICAALEALEPAGARFREDTWTREGGGGGRTRVLADGEVFEKVAVNVSEVHGELSAEAQAGMPGEGASFYATGLSLVAHPLNPYAPTAHCNFRFLTRGAATWWFGGGADLTPYYPFLEDARHFHATLRAACDAHDPAYYAKFKAWCDRYFALPHRDHDTRGVGGIFFDYLTGADPAPIAAFWREAGRAFVPAYAPIVERRRRAAYGERERYHQEVRRGRYAEFNLIWDRGTQFGLRTGGRTESILVSLPPRVRWVYDYRPAAGTPEAEAAEFFRPRDWLGE